MKKLLKNLFFTLIILITFSACKSVKDGLTGKKQTNSDEFLVKKKNPLSLPPEFEKLPEPKTLTNNNDQNDSEISIKEILTKNTTEESTVSTDEVLSDSLEKSILEKIKSN
ncbi:DUF3035 domain-containing protein [Candidatus Pelagibacter sp.]|nr:DUF3035 domain-containing protein [Candidatus Pelagibacter sp.]